jgi:hypothetical protein
MSSTNEAKRERFSVDIGYDHEARVSEAARGDAQRKVRSSRTSSTRNGIQPIPRHPTTPPNAFPCVPLCASTSAIRRRHAHNIFPHALSPSRQTHRGTTIQPRRNQPSPSPPPFRPLMMPRLPIPCGCLRLWDERGWRVCTPPQDDSTPMRFIRERVPEVRHDERPNADPGAAFSPSFHSSRVLEGGHGRPGCLIWRGYFVRGALLFCSLPPFESNVSPPFSFSQGRARVPDLPSTTRPEPLATLANTLVIDARLSASRCATQHGDGPHRCLSVIRRLRCSCRSGSGSMLSPR